MPQVRETCGEILPNGAIIDLVAGDPDGLNLLCSDGKEEPAIQQVIHRGDVVYQPPALHQSIREAITFPRGVADYGGVRQLFMRMCGLYQEHLRLPADAAAFQASWDIATWLADWMQSPLSMCIIGATLSLVFNLFRMSKCLCRRGLQVAKLTPQLPLFLRPTLFITDPKLSARDCAFWSAANYHGVVVPGPGGMLSDLTCAKAILLGAGESAEVWGAEAMCLSLPPVDAPDLGDSLLEEIRTEFQPQLQAYRLDWLRRKDEFVAKSHGLSKLTLARRLFACIQGDPEIIQMLKPSLELYEQERRALRSRDPRAAIQESIWNPSHQEGEMSTSEITKRTNALLHLRGEPYRYNSREIGWHLKKLGLHTQSNGKCKVLRFPGENRHRIHQCVREFGLQLRFFDDCPDCNGLQVTEGKLVEQFLPLLPFS